MMRSASHLLCLHCSIFVESHSIALQRICYSIVTALLTVALEQRVQHASVVTVFSSLFSAILPKAKVNV